MLDPANKQLRYIPLKYNLMGSFLLLIIPILVATSVFFYLNAKNDLENAYKLLQKQTENNVVNAIKLVDAGYKVLEKFISKEMGDEMKHGFAKFIHEYEKSDRNPAKIDLESLKKQLGGKMDLYIISADGIIEYATRTNDVGLDFKNMPDIFAYFTAIRQNGKFVEERLATEARTGLLRKYAYMPTPDGKYLLELGLTIDQFMSLVGELDLIKITNRLRTLNPALNKVRVFTRHGNLLSDTDYKVDAKTVKIVTDVYKTEGVYDVVDEAKKLYIHYSFVNLRDDTNDDVNSPDSSRIIELSYNTKLVDESLEKTASFNFLLGIVTIILSIVITFIISAWITRPIQRMVDSVNRIALGDLEYPIQVNTNNELKLLKFSITLMVKSILEYMNQVKQQNLDLKELDKLKDDFLSNTSHELRTPINGIIGIADSMIDGATGQLPRKAIENLSMIVLSGRRLANLVNDILDFSKLKHKNLTLQIKPIEIKIVVDVVITLSSPLIGSKKITFINHIRENELLVDADENRVQQILHNIIGNSVKFTDEGTIEISAAVYGENYLMIAVTDTGIGIPADKIRKVFTPFEQADGSLSREYGGTGLGLSITRQLVELHGGEIRIQSKLGKGTKVSFTLPLSKATVVERTLDATTLLNRVRDLQPIEISVEKEIKEIVSRPLKTASSNNGSLLNVLIVDDDPINLQVLENQLTLENYQVTRANNGKEALDAIDSGKSFVMVLLDIMMPKMSGFEVCKIIRRTYSATELPIIMLTAKNQVSDLVEGLQSGANDYLTKPFSKGELITRIKTHIYLSRVNTAYNNFVPLEFLQQLEKESIIDVKLGDHVQKQMSVLFADIRSFTTLSENLTPKETFEFINQYLGRVSPVIRKYNGFIDKYIGDAIMALFPSNADDAVQAAVEIHYQLALFNQERAEQGLHPIKIGIGIHIGTLMLGTIGEAKRMEGTVISDAVNLASRLEGLTKLYGASIIVSGEILSALQDPSHYYHRFLGKVRVKGKYESVNIFEIIDAEPADMMQKKIALESTFNQALDMYYQQQFNQAIQQFSHILIESPQDAAALFYLQRCSYYLAQGIPQDWEGVEVLG